ncbi:hypothetical protein CFT12S00416_05545 [Campylobacter fetus subsp. testudinum]|uniref:hypothetical protein n=1 Tax=Campylobacter fetus TaxID=196 RepID=UPI00081875C9|nr:hypothetical protein [Campylobacter fetus]OCR88888.1 hypothetical protein CFT12S00416_05545 [Campylobacter fetus subsp. testudinum]
MDYIEFKELLNYELRGDGAFPSDNIIFSTIEKCASSILSSNSILSHIEIDKRGFTPLYYIDEYYFVRKFNNPAQNGGAIDFIDLSLINALICLCAANISLNEKNTHKNRAAKFLMQYENSINDTKLDSLEKLLFHRGYAKPYTLNYAINPYYVWDTNFLDSLDTWMSDYAKLRGLCYEKFIELFVDFQNGKNDRSDMRDLNRVLCKKVDNGRKEI